MRNEEMMKRYLLENKLNVFPDFTVDWVRGAGEYILLNELGSSEGCNTHPHQIEAISVMTWLYSKLPA